MYDGVEVLGPASSALIPGYVEATMSKRPDTRPEKLRGYACLKVTGGIKVRGEWLRNSFVWGKRTKMQGLENVSARKAELASVFSAYACDAFWQRG